MTTERLLKRVKEGEIIIVRAKNGQSFPSFNYLPSAYRCTIGKNGISGLVVRSLLNRRLIVPVKRGWYSEGRFKFNNNLRDRRGRFQKVSHCPQDEETAHD